MDSRVGGVEVLWYYYSVRDQQRFVEINVEVGGFFYYFLIRVVFLGWWY